MRRVLQAGLLTSTILAGLAVCAGIPAYAQMDQTYGSDQSDSSISFDYFQDQLAPYGYWLYSDRWGVVWQPFDASYDFRPYYSSGQWVYTDDYGWYWQSQYPWGDIPFHYGRWVNDPDDGWLWIPGYVWSPGWVTWRSNGQYIGWMPMPPDDEFLGGRGDLPFGVSFRFGLGDVGGLYGYSRWYGPAYDENRFAQNWVFVGLGQIAAPDYRAVAITDPTRIVNIIHVTRNVTNYTVVNNYVVNKSVDVRVVERAAGRPIPVVRAATVIRRPNLVTSVAVGQRVQVRMRAVAPRGMGVANSAPPPPPHVVAKLSTNVTPRNGHAPVHLFTRATVSAPEAQSRFHGPAVHAPAENAPEAGGAMGSGGERPHEAPPGGGPGMTGPTSERPHEAPPGGGPGMTGPTGERPHEAPPGGGPGMTEPTRERPHEAPPGGGPGTTEPTRERPHETPPGGGPGATEPTRERAHETPPGGGPGMTEPTRERPHEAPPGGMAAPRAAPAAHPHPEEHKAPPPENPQKKKEPPKPPGQ